MKIFNALDETLNYGAKVKVLRFLAVEKGEYTGRRIAKAIRMSASSIHRALQEMKTEGVVSARKVGNAILYKLRKDNYIVKNLIQPLFENEKKIYGDLVLLIKKGLQSGKGDVTSIAFFGSVAEKRSTVESDIDLLVVTKTKKGKRKVGKLMDKLSIDIAKEFQTLLSPYILTRDEIRKMNDSNINVVKAILKNNRLIDGEPIERVLA